MFPILDVFSESLGASLLRYRLERLPAAIERAKQYGVDGASFPWTSTQSGE
jgi:trehalose/maltose hydrolase-like predicted phosphorylase